MTTITAQQRTETLERHSYVHDFAILNKSYAKDLEWSRMLYRSWVRLNGQQTPYYVVVPHGEFDLFDKAFDEDVLSKKIDSKPEILTEEWLFETCGINVPDHFDGWHRQQVVKLGFSKTGLARNYITMDSAAVLDKKITLQAFSRDNQIFTNSHPVSKSAFYADLASSGAKGWLNGRLVDLGEAFGAVCTFMGNNSDDTNMYVSGTGLFDSDLARDLERYAHEEGVDGFAGCLLIAPYEFAWYGEFVFSRHRALHLPFGPHMVTFVESAEAAEAFLRGDAKISSHDYGMMFQPPASDMVSPQKAYDLLTE